jgi:hypothetical protein
MGDSSAANPTEMSGRKPSWPKLSLFVSVLLWLLAWEVIVWFVAAQPRLVIPTHNLETQTSEYLMGFSPDGRTLVNAVEQGPNQPGIVYHLWDTRTGQDLGMIGNEKKNFLPNVVYCRQKDLLKETWFPFNGSETYVIYDLTSHQGDGYHPGKTQR